MIIEPLINFWKGDSTLKDIFYEFDEMLVISKDMFTQASNALFENPDNKEEITRELIKLDGKINALQQNVRRDIVLHITVQGTKDILPCLLLMSLVKDAERLGDYSKNIMEIAERFTKFERGKYFESLKQMQKDIIKWFTETRDSFKKIDVEHANNVRAKAFETEKECDKFCWELTQSEGKIDAVALALIFRFFKRISAHLGNICTSVVMPLDKLDYHDES